MSKKDKQASVESYSIACKFCGKTSLNVDNIDFENQEHATDYATLNCNCVESEKYRLEKTKAEKRKKNIDSLNEFVEHIEQKFTEEITFGSDIKDLLKRIGIYVLDSESRSTKVVISVGQCKFQFYLSKGYLFIATSYTDVNKNQVSQ